MITHSRIFSTIFDLQLAVMMHRLVPAHAGFMLTYTLCLQELEALKGKVAKVLSCHISSLNEVQAADHVSLTPVSCCWCCRLTDASSIVLLSVSITTSTTIKPVDPLNLVSVSFMQHLMTSTFWPFSSRSLLPLPTPPRPSLAVCPLCLLSPKLSTTWTICCSHLSNALLLSSVFVTM